MVVNSSSSSKDQKPRLSCMDKGPGPGKYNLPSTCGYQAHDISQRANPAYSFGTRYKQFSSLANKPCSPGPVHFVTPQITRRGKEGGPSYTIYGRLRSLSVPPTPGPAAYDVPTVKEKRPPSYSMGARLSPLSRPSTPAPNAYNIPASVGGKGNSASYSLLGRSKIGSFHQDLKKTPGPGTYQVIATSVTRIKSPSYSMGSRVFPPEGWKGSPGPAAYQAGLMHKPSSPAHSFGIRHSDYVAPVLDKSS